MPELPMSKTATSGGGNDVPVSSGVSMAAALAGRLRPGLIRNKMKRTEMHKRLKADKKKLKKDMRKKRQREAEELGEDAPAKQVPRTIENTREVDATVVSSEDTEVLADIAGDEFARIFSNDETPKIMITTRPRPSGELFKFAGDLMAMMPNAFYYPRKSFEVKKICKWAGNKKFTHLMVLSEKSKVCNGVIISRLPCGPTAYFKVSNVVPGTKIKFHGKRSAHQPELILNNFNTRLGNRIGRFLGSLFPHDPEFEGRQVVTFHNQRDYIFVRQHRYVFEGEDGRPCEKARLQELGPRFTLRLRWLQEGTFDTQFGEYEWIHKRKEMDTSRRKFFL